MLRISNILYTLVRRKSHLVLDHKQCATVFKVPYSFIQNACYSDTKAKSPLGNIINKDAIEKEHDYEEEQRKQREASWKTMKRTLTAFGVTFLCLGGYLIISLGGPELDSDGDPVHEEDLKDKPIWQQYLIRTYRELDYYRRLIREPSREKLLPDPLEYPYIQPKYTLVLELTDVLVHPDWTYNTGWRFKKRPGLDYFLETLQGQYEIVIYTAEQGMTVFPLMEALDPKNIISYKLVRDATHFSGGHHVKSLDKLNRDLSKVICIDWNPKNVKFNPENLFNIKRWNGNDHDTSLMDLASFLKTIADNDIEDVREVLKNYSEYEDPIEAFREKQKKLIDQLEAQAAAKRDQDVSKASRWTPNFFNRKPF
ncbi:mitochondrial import inner membrane translocase subunit TIM50-C-like [Aethina tumida]|uniref:mitochondrial import inner membrane translocase subunit TIM50-C-like n=1 Tax=Aethina tumida TaxID=116153 RepID=UPI00096B67F8|nr:mitochondrial import inner membrane translocase subunit TIM50-C-like [Aethina tumida]